MRIDCHLDGAAKVTWRFAALALVAGLWAPSAGAQTVQGSLLRADSTPASGVIVVAVRAGPDSVLSRTITNGNGRFTMTVTPGSVVLRALRIGHRPFVLAELTLAAGARRDVRAVLPNDPIVLSAVTTEASSSCRQTGAAGANVAAVFEEARKALLASTLKSGDGDPLARLSVYEQARSVGNRAGSPPKLEFQEGVTVKPFQSLKPDSLAKVGFMQQDLTSNLYWAPDADVLLSETFASTHCLGLAEGKGVRLGMIGLTFRPAQFRRGFVDVSGTLWLDRATNELRTMEYRYEGLPITMQRAEPGGEVEFTRLPDGIWFVSKWEIRMPRTTLPPGPPRLVGTWVKGGEVWWIRRGRDLLYTNGREEPKPAALEAARRAARAVADSTPSVVTCAPTRPDAPAGTVFGAVTDERGAPLADAVVTVEWQGSYATTGRQLSWQMQGLSTITARDGTYSLCGVPSERLLNVQAQFATRKTPKVSTRLANSAKQSRVDLRVPGVRGAVPPGAAASPPPPPLTSVAVEQVVEGARGELVPVASFDGLGVGFIGQSPLLRNPSDNALAVGPDHLVQIVNSQLAVFTKRGTKFDTTGRLLKGAVPTNSLFQGFGGQCEARNNGDAVARYDQLAGRWLIVMPIFRRPANDSLTGPFSMCYAVSKTGDPLGEYYRYEFKRPLFPDYPRPAVWPDGYYIPTSTGDNVIEKHACVAERAKMLRGEPAREQCVIIKDVNFLNNADLDGYQLPPEGAPNPMLATGGAQLKGVTRDDGVYVWNFHVDWNDTTRTRVTGPVKIDVAPYDYLCGGQLTNCVPQPDTLRRLDAQGDKLMNRVVYRRIGQQETIVALHSVNTSAGGGGVRWYEFRIGEERAVRLHQQGTYAPGGFYRWMGSIGMDGAGNIAMGYSFGGTPHFAGQRAAARAPSDAPGQMGFRELVIAAGQDSQRNTMRWEDYTTLAMDPDDCTFWYVGDYYKKGATSYSTRITGWRVSGCRRR